MMTICMAATYDPDPDAPLGFHLPFDLQTCEVDEARWIPLAEVPSLRRVMVGGAPMYATKNIVENAMKSKDHETLVAAVKAAIDAGQAKVNGLGKLIAAHVIADSESR